MSPLHLEPWGVLNRGIPEVLRVGVDTESMGPSRPRRYSVRADSRWELDNFIPGGPTPNIQTYVNRRHRHPKFKHLSWLVPGFSKPLFNVEMTYTCLKILTMRVVISYC